MNYLAYYKEDYANGEGRRVTLFVSGCEHGCKGCHNAESWNPEAGLPVDAEMVGRIIADLKDADGFTLSGGDPLFPANRTAVRELLYLIKKKYPDKDVWMWTGYKYEDVKDVQALKFVDVLIDGKYEKELPAAPWRGSNNQRIIHLEKLHD